MNLCSVHPLVLKKETIYLKSHISCGERGVIDCKVVTNDWTMVNDPRNVVQVVNLPHIPCERAVTQWSRLYTEPTILSHELLPKILSIT